MNAAPPVTPLIEVRGLVAELHTRQGVVRAIDGIDLEIADGEFVAQHVAHLEVAHTFPMGGLARRGRERIDGEH